jgi:hypothetical protein
MVIPYHDQRVLRRTTRALSAADPHLAGMLAIFTRLSAGQALPRREQIRGLVPRALLAIAGAAALAVDLLACVVVWGGRCAFAAAGACRAAARCSCRFLGAGALVPAAAPRLSVPLADGMDPPGD